MCLPAVPASLAGRALVLRALSDSNLARCIGGGISRCGSAMGHHLRIQLRYRLAAGALKKAGDKGMNQAGKARKQHTRAKISCMHHMF